jgi:hypothetical protein
VLFAAAEAEPKVFQLLLKHEDLLHLSDAVINAWRKQLERCAALRAAYLAMNGTAP